LHKIRIFNPSQIVELDRYLPKFHWIIESHKLFEEIIKSTISGEGDEIEVTVSDAIMPMSLLSTQGSVYGVRLNFRLANSEEIREDIEQERIDLTLISARACDDVLRRRYYVAGILFGPYSLFLPISTTKRLKIIARSPDSMGFRAYREHMEPLLKEYGVETRYQFSGNITNAAKDCCEFIEEIKCGEAIEVDRWQLWAPAIFLAKWHTYIKEFSAGNWFSIFVVRKDLVEELGPKAREIVHFLAERIEELNNPARAYFAAEMAAEIISKKMPEVERFSELVEAYIQEEEMADYDFQEIDKFDIHTLERLYKYPHSLPFEDFLVTRRN
jgi:hypothetical protein